MMNHTNEWMGHWMGGGIWPWTVLTILAVAVIALVIKMITKK